MKFEYKIISETVPHGMQEELLNIMGAEGWELVHYDPDTRIVHSKATMYAVFKRDVEAWEKDQAGLRFAEELRQDRAEEDAKRKGRNVRK